MFGTPLSSESRISRSDRSGLESEISYDPNGMPETQRFIPGTMKVAGLFFLLIFEIFSETGRYSRMGACD